MERERYSNTLGHLYQTSGQEASQFRAAVHQAGYQKGVPLVHQGSSLRVWYFYTHHTVYTLGAVFALRYPLYKDNSEPQGK